MVIAFSRFKVMTGCEAVREAFLHRPGLVDTASGFLGMEVFTDTADASLFYLITRWTDVESFESWHSSPAHNQSHAGIPKGLKLDAAFTLVRTLDRIAAPAGCFDPDGVRDFASVISEFLTGSSNVYWVRAGHDGVILASTHAVASIVRGTAGSLDGVSIWPLLTEPDRATLRCAIESGTRDPATRYRLNFVGLDQMPFTLECHLDVYPDGFTLIGEPLQQHQQALERELMALNNRLAVLLRENDRKAKALSKANTSLEKALKDLNDSHWHLRKIQEVLPVCMRCGKIKTGEAKWEEIVQYLEQNNLLVSHSYCPECLARELDAIKQ